MGFKENMMEKLMGKMSSEEKKDMMDKMMEGFFSSMTKKEKQEMMSTMMPKMMEHMMGNPDSSGDSGNPMMNMMNSMMGGKSSMMGMMNSMMGSMEGNNKGSGFNPMDMCKNMMATISKSSEIATFATPEVRQMFEDWVQQVDEEILGYIKETGSTNPDQIAAHLKISKNSVIYFLSRLAQKGELSIKIEKTEVL